MKYLVTQRHRNADSDEGVIDEVFEDVDKAKKRGKMLVNRDGRTAEVWQRVAVIEVPRDAALIYNEVIE